MKKTLLSLAVIGLVFAGCEKSKDHSSEATNNPQTEQAEQKAPKDLNKSIDEIAKKAKEFGSNIQNFKDKAQKELHNFAEKNKDKIEKFKKDANESMQNLKNSLEDLAKDANKSLNNLAKDFKEKVEENQKDKI